MSTLSAPTLSALAAAYAGELLGRLGPVHCEEAVGQTHIAHAVERHAAARSDAIFPAERGAFLATVEHGAHEHPFLLLAARAGEGDPWSVLELAGLMRRPRANVRFVLASTLAVAVGHFSPDERALRLWLRLADGTGDVGDRFDDAILVVAAVSDPVRASPARLEYLALDGTTVTAEDIVIRS